MIHRIRLNRKRVLGPNGQVVSANTTTWVSGSTLTQQWTNSNEYPTLGNPNGYPSPMSETNVTNTVPFNQKLYSKSIVIPIELKFEPMDYSDIIDDWVGSETQRVINQIQDGEKVKYISDKIEGIDINFRFLDKITSGYTTEYQAAGFTIPDEFKTNRFKKSYFRLYFYDSNNSETANLLFTEELPVTQISDATFNLKRLFWDRDDELMFNNLTNRVIYMEARFFNAKTGQIQTFFNPPTTFLTPMGISSYSNTNNRGWRTSPIELINRNNRNGEYRFRPLVVGGTNATAITMSEFILT